MLCLTVIATHSGRSFPSRLVFRGLYFFDLVSGSVVFQKDKERHTPKENFHGWSSGWSWVGKRMERWGAGHHLWGKSTPTLEGSAVVWSEPGGRSGFKKKIQAEKFIWTQQQTQGLHNYYEIGPGRYLYSPFFLVQNILVIRHTQDMFSITPPAASPGQHYLSSNLISMVAILLNMLGNRI